MSRMGRIREVASELEIAAPAGRIWDVLADLGTYPQWNPFIRSASGDLRVGARLQVVIQPPGRRAVRFRPTVVHLEPERELRWLGRLLMRGIFDGEHTLRIERVDDGRSRFVQRERFSGVLVGLLGRQLDATARGFEAMNEALRGRVEST